VRNWAIKAVMRAVPRHSGDEVDDSFIVKRVLKGDVDAYAELVRRHQPSVWKVASAMLHDLRATEETVQQTFVDAFERLETFQAGGDFGAWIKAIARNRVRMDARSRSREGRRLKAYQAYLEERLSGPTEDPAEEALRRCREELPERGAEAIALRYDEALDVGTVASRLGRSIEATRQFLFRLRTLLRDCVERRLARP
jgi:RNA polymerase sigma-70 factor (ECF subfamily)